jgi:hypothetical protein
MDTKSKTPLDYTEELSDIEFSELILELCVHKGVNLIFNQKHCEILINSKFALAKEALDGIFIESDICIEAPPKSGEIKQRFLQTALKILHQEQLGKLLNLEASKVRRTSLMTSTFPLNLNPGSKLNMEFLQLLRDTENKEIFRGSLKEIVDLKWQQMRIPVIVHSMAYFMNACLVGLHLVMINRPGLKMKRLLIFINLMQSTREVLQMIQQCKKYFLDFWNWLDFFGLSLFLIYILFGRLSSCPQYREVSDYLYLISIFLIVLRGSMAMFRVIQVQDSTFS